MFRRFGSKNTVNNLRKIAALNSYACPYKFKTKYSTFNSHQTEKALTLYKEHYLVPFKQSLPLACIPQQPQYQQDSHYPLQETLQTFIPEHISEILIKGARAVKIISFGLRAAFVCILTAETLYEAYQAKDAPEIVKDFCYQEAGRRDFEIKTEKGDALSFSVMGKRLYVPIGYSYYSEDEISLEKTLKKRQQLEIELQQHIKKGLEEKECELSSWRDKKHEIEKALEKNKARLNLFKGILDHEMAHLIYHHAQLRFLILFWAFIGMERIWSKIRDQLESNFKKSAIGPSSKIKKVVIVGGRWLTKLVAPTALYTGTFFATRQLIKQTIEAHADANVRDDIDVLTEMEKMFRESAARPSNNVAILRYLDMFFDSHPSDESRANYFSQRIKELEERNSPSPTNSKK